LAPEPSDLAGIPCRRASALRCVGSFRSREISRPFTRSAPRPVPLQERQTTSSAGRKNKIPSPRGTGVAGERRLKNQETLPRSRRRKGQSIRASRPISANGFRQVILPILRPAPPRVVCPRSVFNSSRRSPARSGPRGGVNKSALKADPRQSAPRLKSTLPKRRPTLPREACPSRVFRRPRSRSQSLGRFC